MLSEWPHWLSPSSSYEGVLSQFKNLLHLGEILGKNLWYLFTTFPLVFKCLQSDTIPLVQYTFSKPTEGGHIGSVFITCRISHLCPGYYLCWTYGWNLRLSLVLSHYHQTLPLNLGVLLSLLEEVLGYCLNHMIMSSSSNSRVPLLVHQACQSLIPHKVFLQKHKDLSRMISEPDAFSFDIFSEFQFWRSPKSFFWISFRIFWSSNLSWIGTSFNRHFSILCSDLNFPFFICRLFGCFSSVLSFLCVTPNHSRKMSFVDQWDP